MGTWNDYKLEKTEFKYVKRAVSIKNKPDLYFVRYRKDKLVIKTDNHATAHDAAISLDVQLIKNGREPINLLKKI